MSNMTDLRLSGVFFQGLNAQKLVSAGALPRQSPGSRWEAYDAPSDPVVGCAGGHPLPILFPARCLRLSGPPTQSRGYVYDRLGAHNIAPHIVLCK